MPPTQAARGKTHHVSTCLSEKNRRKKSRRHHRGFLLGGGRVWGARRRGAGRERGADGTGAVGAVCGTRASCGTCETCGGFNAGFAGVPAAALFSCGEGFFASAGGALRASNAAAAPGDAGAPLSADPAEPACRLLGFGMEESVSVGGLTSLACLLPAFGEGTGD